MILDKLPDNYYTADEVIARLKKHTAKNPIFDLQQIVDDLDYWQVARNPRLGVMAKNDKGEYYRIGSIYAVIPNQRDLEVLKWEVKETYKRVSGKTVNPEKKVRNISTTVDDLDGTNPQPRVNKKSETTKYGEKMKSGKLVNENTGSNA